MNDSRTNGNASTPEESRTDPVVTGPHEEIIGLSIDRAGQLMADGELTSVDLTRMYLDRIRALDQDGPKLGAIMEINPDAQAIAESMDAERANGNVRGPLHGIPVLLKDNIDTADSMHTTAGSMSLINSTPPQDAFVVTRLRDAGAVILGKTNMCEWADFRDPASSSGWSARGGMTYNPYSLNRSPGGSSGGSAVAMAASLALMAVGTDTLGSIVLPASINGVVGMKPTLGLVSRAGVIPASSSQDSVGPLARSVTDVAISLTVMVGVDDRDQATQASGHMAGTDFCAHLNADALKGARLGVPTNFDFQGYSRKADTVFRGALETLASLGAEIIEPLEVPTADQLSEEPGMWERLLWDFRRDLKAYLEERGDPNVRSMADVIAFDDAHSSEELRYFGQKWLHQAEATRDNDPRAMEELDERLKRLSRDEGIDALLSEHKLDALIAPTMSPAAVVDFANGEDFAGAASDLSSIAGYPNVTVPAGRVHGLPVGLSFIGTAWSDASLLSMAYAWEQATQVYRDPTYSKEDIVIQPETPLMELPPLYDGKAGTPAKMRIQ